MIIDEVIKNNLLTWNNDEPIYKQFEKKCAIISKLSSLDINPEQYRLQYELHASEMDRYVDLQTELYEILYEKYPELEFGSSGRLKSPYSHYEKVIRKFVALLEKDEFKTVEILDDYAMKVFIFSVSYDITKVSVDLEGIYVDSGTDEFRITNNDVFVFNDDGKNIQVAVTITDDGSNVWIDNSIPYISTTINDEEKIFPLNNAITYKKSNREDLVEYCYEFQKDIEAFFNSKKFDTKKRKDYISRRKPSGYESRQCSFYSEELDLGIECQIKTKDMDDFSNWERAIGYKPQEKKVSPNSLSKLSRFALTTRFEDGGVQTYTMSDSECFEYLFGMSLAQYRKLNKPQSKPVINQIDRSTASKSPTSEADFTLD